MDPRIGSSGFAQRRTLPARFDLGISGKHPVRLYRHIRNAYQIRILIYMKAEGPSSAMHGIINARPRDEQERGPHSAAVHRVHHLDSQQQHDELEVCSCPLSALSSRTVGCYRQQEKEGCLCLLLRARDAPCTGPPLHGLMHRAPYTWPHTPGPLTMHGLIHRTP